MNAAMLRERKGNKQTNKHNRPAKLQDKDIVEIYESYNAWREKATNKHDRPVKLTDKHPVGIYEFCNYHTKNATTNKQHFTLGIHKCYNAHSAKINNKQTHTEIRELGITTWDVGTRVS